METLHIQFYTKPSPGILMFDFWKIIFNQSLCSRSNEEMIVA